MKNLLKGRERLSVDTGIGETLIKATEHERKYEWLESSGLLERAMGGVGVEDFLKRGEVQERFGLCLHMAAFQAESQEEFRRRLGLAVEAYRKTRELYERPMGKECEARVLRCRAIVRYLEHWMASDTSEKRRLLDECLELEEDALNAFWGAGNKIEYVRTFSELSYASWLRFELEWDGPLRKELVEGPIEWGEKVIEALSEIGESRETAKALSILPLYVGFSQQFVEEQDRHPERVIELCRKALELSERVGEAYAIGLSHICYGYFFTALSPRGRGHLDKALECGEKMRDKFLKAMSLDWLSYSWYWEALTIEDPDQRSELLEKAMRLYDGAHHNYSVLSNKIPRGGKIGAIPPGGYAEYYYDKASWETELIRRRELLDKSESDGLEALKMAEESDVPRSVYRMTHVLSRTLTAKARLEPDVGAKRVLLEAALKHRERNLGLVELLEPFQYWNRGVYNYLLANIKSELSIIESIPENERRLLEDSVKTMGKSLKDMNRTAQQYERIGNLTYFASLCRYQDGYGKLLTRLYEATNNPEHLRKAIEAWEWATDSARKVEMVARIAESNWRIARTQATLGEHVKAAENFKRASESYEEAAEKMPQLKMFYKEYESYMQAWSELEKAKHSHTEKKYLQAKEHYEKAAQLHRSTERWSYLTPNYLAWARLEEAEDLSRNEQTEEAREFFQQAFDYFKEAKETIENKLDKTLDDEERKQLDNLVQASDTRREYCLGRIALEDGRILDGQGDHAASSRKYKSAAETFQGIAATSVEALKEFKPLVCLCQAWQKMTEAEAETSPELYIEASRLFEEARDNSQDERSRRLSLGHSRFCLALESCARFEDTSDIVSYNEALQNLESAARHYVRAGYKSAADYAEATERLLNAYLYMNNASGETDPQKMARWFEMAERILETSAGGFMTAKHPEKSVEVQRLLGRVKEKRELASSLSEVMHAPTTLSTTEAFTAPSPTQEVAVGLERFENADIQASLILGSREVKIGDDVNLEIELVNAGKAPAQLIKVTEIVPKGFKVSSAPEFCRVKDSFIDMKGRTLLPLKTQELKLVMQPTSKGVFEFKPRVLYLDEAGKYRSHEPEPVTITVQELGITGWLRGSTR